MTDSTNVLAALRTWLAADPMAPALRAPQAPWLSRQELMRRIEAGHAYLRGAGLGPADRVALLMPQGLDGAIVTLQVATACTLAPLRPGLPAGQWPELLTSLAPAALVVSPQCNPDIAAVAQGLGIRVLASDHLLEAQPAADTPSSEPPTNQPQAECALVIATSGTTGRPKWVVLNQSSVLKGCQTMARSLALTAADRTILALPLHHTHGLVSGLLMPLITGGSVVVTSGFDADDMIRLLGEEGVSWITLPPAMHLELLDAYERAPQAPRHQLRFLRSGAVSLPLRQIERLQAAFGVPVVEAYGMSECPHISSNPLGNPRPGSVGKPVVEQLAIIDADGHQLPAGKWGQVIVRGAPLMEGYLNNDGRHSETIRDGWLHTGDEGRLDDDGYLELRGRLQEGINRGGLKVAPVVVEAALLSHADVREALTCAVPHPTLGEDVIAAVVLRNEAAFDQQDLRRHAFLHLEPHEVPSRIIPVKTLPRGFTGKPNRRLLAEQLSDQLRAEGDLARPGLESVIATTFGTVLKRNPPGRDANFFALGGDSLSGMRVITELEHQLELALKPSLLFHFPCVAELAEEILCALQERGVPIRSAEQNQSHPTPLSSRAESDFSNQENRVYPTSFAQARLWFLQQLHSDLTAYHLPALWRLQGDLELSALNQALNALIKRHPTLRSSFELHGDEVVQIIHPAACFQLLPEPRDDRTEQEIIEHWLREENSTPFDLSSGLLLRARLLQLTQQEHLLLINLHHIASDGWSQSILSHDLTVLYNAFLTGHPSPLQPLPVHYHDYATWQHQRLSGDRLQMLKEYWTLQLSELEPLELPSDRPRPATPSHQGASISFRIAPELVAPLEDLCRSEGATLQMGLLALVTLLLHRYSRQDDLAIGVPIRGRNHPDLEPLIGFFVNTLPIRTQFTTGHSFRELLQQVKATSLAAYDHQDLPFEQIVQAIHPERDRSRNPLVQVMLQLVELPEASLQGMKGLSVESLSTTGPAESSRFDLEFFFRRTDHDGLEAQLIFATDLFLRGRIERLSAHLLTLLASTVESPDAAADSLKLLPDAERQLIESWQQGPSVGIPDLCVHQLFEQQVERTPDAIALVFGEQQLTYQELNARANQLAHHLISLGVEPEIIVAVSLERSIELIVSLLAIFKAGGAYLPLDPEWPQEWRQRLTHQCNCLVLIDQNGIKVLSPGPSAPERRVGSPLAYVTTTSGSTGIPKAVAITHAGILRLVNPVNGFLLSSGQRVLQLAPVAFDAATFEIWGPLLNGGTLVIAPAGRLSSTALADQLRHHRITCLWLTAGFFHAMVEHDLHALCEVRQLLAGGDVLSPEHVQRLLHSFPADHQLINGYGPTENTTFTCCQLLTAGTCLNTNTVPIGRPIAATIVRVLDRSGQLCGIGIPGEIHIGGAGLARGYLNNQALTTRSFIPDLFSGNPSDRLYRSGDLAFWNPDGTLTFVGRVDCQVKIRGYRIEPAEVEAALRGCKGIRDAAVLAQKDNAGDMQLVAYLTGTPDRMDGIRRELAETLPQHMLPAAFMVLERLPLTPNGKLDRKALPDPSFSGGLEKRVAPTTALQRQLHRIWADLLGHSDFGITDNFFLVGGHSLAAARLAAAVENTPQELSVADIFRLPTIAELAALLSGNQKAPRGALVPLQPEGDRPPLYGIHGWGGSVGHFIGLARALGPHRPMFGLQACDIPEDTAPQGQVVQMASWYAEQILATHDERPIHLLGFSAGGWYAHAVAAALLQRGARIGLFAVLDSHPAARIDRRLGLQLLAHKLVPRPSHLRRGRLHPNPHRSRPSLLARLGMLNAELYLHLGIRVPSPRRLAASLLGKSYPPPDVRNRFVDLLIEDYCPPRLPITVDVFAPSADLPALRNLWAFYGLKEVCLHPLFHEHSDFVKPERMSELAQALEAALERVERETP